MKITRTSTRFSIYFFSKSGLVRIALCSLIAAISACGGGGGGGNTSPSKDLFSVWTNEANQNIRISLVGGTLGATFAYNLFAPDGAQCNCDVTIIGSQSEGNYVLNNCSYQVGSSAGGDPGCNAQNDTGTYTKTTTRLTICDSSTICNNYK